MSNSVGPWDRRTVGRWLTTLAWAVPLSIGPAVPLFAQVGHDPGHSPFQDINTHQQIGFSIGNFFGNTAAAGVGAQRGTSFGIRFRNKLAGPLDLSVGGSYITSQRLVIDPTKPDASRRSGPIPYDNIEGDIGLTLTLTGMKSWHGLAPYVGFGFGIITPTSSRTDPGGYRAGTNFTFTPSIGTHIFLNRKFSILVEARDNTIRYEWPLSYFDPRDASNNSLPPPVLDPTANRDKQLTHNFTISAGVTYHFNL